MKKVLLALGGLALAASMVVPATSFATVGTETQAYVNAVVIGDVFFPICDRTSGVNLAGACFSLNGSETTASATITDAVPSVCALYFFEDVDGTHIGEGDVIFEGSVEDVAIPAGAVTFNVSVDGPLFATSDCGSPAKFATAGTITAILS